MKSFSKTLKWHNALILKKLLKNKHRRQDTNLIITNFPSALNNV